MPEPIRVLKNEATAARRRAYFHCVDATDGMTPETGEAGGQPQISVDGAAYTNTGIGTLTAISNGDYYADVTQATVNVDYAVIRTRYKSANTAEAPGSVLLVSSNWDRIDAALSDIHTDVGTAVSDIAAVHTHAQTIIDDVAAVHVHVDDIHATDLPAVKSDTAAILEDTGTTLDDILDTLLAFQVNKLVTTDNGDGTLTAVLYAGDGTTPLKTRVFTTATGTRGAAT